MMTAVRGYVQANAACTIKEFADNLREGKCFGVEWDKEGGFGWRFGGHGSADRVARGHVEVVEDVGDVMGLSKEEEAT